MAMDMRYPAARQSTGRIDAIEDAAVVEVLACTLVQPPKSAIVTMVPILPKVGGVPAATAASRGR